jgi:hypothetical protein
MFDIAELLFVTSRALGFEAFKIVFAESVVFFRD